MLDKLMQDYKGQEQILHRQLKAQYGGFHKATVSETTFDLLSRACRICGEFGHWGNACPKRTKPPIVPKARIKAPEVPTQSMLPGHEKQQRKLKIPTQDMMVSKSVRGMSEGLGIPRPRARVVRQEAGCDAAGDCPIVYLPTNGRELILHIILPIVIPHRQFSKEKKHVCVNFKLDAR